MSDEAQARELLKKLESTNSRNDKKEYIREFLDGLSPEGVEDAVGLLTDDKWDDAGLGKKSVKDALDANWDDYNTVSEAVREELTKEFREEPAEVIWSFGNKVDTLAQLSGNEQKENLRWLVDHASCPELYTHAVLNDLPTGTSSTTVVNAVLHEEDKDYVRRVRGLYGDRTAELISDYQNGELQEEPEIGTPFKPMLAKSNGSPSDDKVYEPKLDGYRIILHVKREETKAYSRRLNDVTESLPELEELELPEGIYDGEVVHEDGSYKSTSERIGRKDVENPDEKMEFHLFDLITREKDLSKHKQSHRKGRLSTAVGKNEIEGGADIVECVKSFDSYAEAKEHVQTEGLEGVIVKDPEAPYTFGKRSSAWEKIKYQDADVDVVIADLEEGDGRLSGSLGDVRIESADGVDLGKVGTGFTDAEREEIWNNKDEWVGKTIEVTAEDFTGDGLRFPRYERDRSDDGEPDSEDRIKEIFK